MKLMITQSLIILSVTTAIKYERCKFLDALKEHGVERLDEAAIFTCLAERLTGLSTNKTAQTLHERYYGLFQVNAEYWCSLREAGCGIECEKLLDDDVGDDIKCAKHIHAETAKIKGSGFEAWPTYEGCKDEVDAVLKSCGLEDDSNDIVEPQKKHKIYEKCELARELMNKHGVQFDKVGTMVCIANEESHFNTSALGTMNKDGSRDYGIFQISEKFWCSDKDGGGCNTNCTSFLDSDLSDDVSCFKRIFDETARFATNGFEAWAVYTREKNHCRDINQSYVEDCFNNSTEGQVYGICELIEKMRGILPADLHAEFACIALYESGLSTGIYNWGHHGIFQISEQKWCRTKDDLPKGCDVSCDKLRDSTLEDDIECVKRMHTLLGFEPWPSYRPFCKDKAYEIVQACPNVARPKKISEDNYYLIQISDPKKQVKSTFQVKKSQLQGNFIKIRSQMGQSLDLSVTIESENEI